MTELLVLIVDDEIGMRLGAERALSDFCFCLSDFKEEIRFRTKTAETGKQALEMLEAEEPDILILDYKLPDIHGLDILGRVLKGRRSLLTIMITAYASLEVAINATKNGAFDFLAKPFTPEELRNTVRKASEHVFLERKAQKLEEEKRQVRFQFISVLAHELKSPLAAVENYLGIMSSHMSGNDIAAYDRMIARSMARLDGMRKLIADLLDLTHIESGQRKRTFEDLELGEIAKAAMDNAEQPAADKKVALAIVCPEPVVFRGDREELEIVFSNLLTNAIKYNKDGGSVRLAVTRGDSGIEIRCEDTGIGMTEEESGRIFNEFSRIKNEKTKHIAGSGLGLSILKKITDLYCGTIEVKSVPDSGTTFTIKFPVKPKKE